ncbi:MAG: tetratricopeptide repeat protein [Chitinophagales bacterium]
MFNPSKITFPQKTHQWMALAAILVITFLCFTPTLTSDFIRTWDDGVYVTNNNQLKPLSFETVRKIFTSTVGSNYNPLPIFTFAIEKQLFGFNPFPYHFNNVLLHLGATALVFWLILAMRIRWEVAVFVSLLFGIHPMRVESVAWITERKDVLFGLFYIAALIAYTYRIRALKEKQRQKARKYFWWCFALFIPALFSKIQAVSLPLSLLALDYYFKRRLSFRLLLEKTPFFLLSLTFGLMGVFFLDKTGALGSNDVFRLSERLLFAPYNLCVYLYKLFVPYPMATFYPYPNRIAGWLPTVYYVAPLVLLAVTAGVLWSLKHTRVLAFGFLFFLFNVVFVLQVVGAGAAFTADRFTYIPYLGLFFVMGMGLNYLLQKFPQSKTVILSISALYLLNLAFYTFQHSKVWKNDETLWTYTIEHYPRAWQGLVNRADYYGRKNDIPKALADYDQAIKVNSGFVDAYNNRGNLYFRLGKDLLALKDYDKALQIRPKNHRALGNRGAIYYRMGQYQKALQDLDKALELNKNYEDGYLNRGVVHSVLGQYPQAKADFDELLRLSPNHVLAFYWRGLALQNMGNFPAAIADFTQAIQRRPKNGTFYVSRSQAYKALDNKKKALADAKKARELGEQLEKGYLEGLE